MKAAARPRHLPHFIPAHDAEMMSPHSVGTKYQSCAYSAVKKPQFLNVPLGALFNPTTKGLIC